MMECLCRAVPRALAWLTTTDSIHAYQEPRPPAPSGGSTTPYLPSRSFWLLQCISVRAETPSLHHGRWPLLVQVHALRELPWQGKGFGKQSSSHNDFRRLCPDTRRHTLLKIIQWLLPSSTGLLLLNLSKTAEGFWNVAGVAVGVFYIWAGLSAAWMIYVRNWIYNLRNRRPCLSGITRHYERANRSGQFKKTQGLALSYYQRLYRQPAWRLGATRWASRANRQFLHVEASVSQTLIACRSPRLRQADSVSRRRSSRCNVKFVFDGNTRKLKSVELINQDEE